MIVRRNIAFLLILAFSIVLTSCVAHNRPPTTSISCAKSSTQNECGVKTGVITTSTSRVFVAGLSDNYGATIGQWNANHTEDPVSSGNFWPRLSDGRDTYSNLKTLNGTVVGFTYALDPSLPIGLARALALSLLPSGSSIYKTLNSTYCEQVIYSAVDGRRPLALFMLDGTDLVKSIIFSVDNQTGPSVCK